MADVVDLLGGVEINVTDAEAQALNKYIQETAKVAGKDAHTLSSGGTYTLDGPQAVTYARLRKLEGGDYKRTERMRDVMEAMLKKLQTKSVSEINNLLNQILPKVYTNITPENFISEIPSITKYKVAQSIGWPYETRGITLYRWYGVPITLESNVQKLHQELFNEPDYVPSDVVKNISQQIINKTGYK